MGGASSLKTRPGAALLLHLRRPRQLRMLPTKNSDAALFWVRLQLLNTSCALSVTLLAATLSRGCSPGLHAGRLINTGRPQEERLPGV